MALTTLGGQLLRVGQQLALSAYCCCTRWCRQTSTDACGNPVYGCSNTQAGSIGECTPECKPPEEPCECGPDKPCEPCFECIDQKCVRIEDCCTSDEDCGPCSKCVDNVCEPCGECEQCMDGLCLPCGPCQKCEDGVCVECGADEVCIDGVCVPKQYYCCWASAEDKRLNTNNTTCKAATVSGGTQTSPCGTDTEEGETGEVDLTKSGPYTSLQQCEPNCRKYKCAPDACGDNECVPDPNGPYSTRAECLAACPANPCSAPCTFGGANAPGIYSIDACERDICVSYVSPDSRPIRVQIWGPSLDANCNIIASRVIKADSDWRGEECCDCDSRPAGDLEGGPKGQITWNKPRGVTSFEVAVLTACGAGANIDIQCSDDCGDPPDPDPCPCAVDADCNTDCHCCDGVCQAEPCEECETDEDCESVVLTCSCDPEPDPNPFPMIFATLAEALAYIDTDLPEGCGGCNTDPTICCNGECQAEPCGECTTDNIGAVCEPKVYISECVNGFRDYNIGLCVCADPEDPSTCNCFSDLGTEPCEDGPP